MAKRELCYKEDVKKNHEKWIGYLDEDMIARLNIAVDKHIPTFTEQDIVKPYLELLLKEMHSLEEINHDDNRYDKGYQHGRASCEAMVMHMISNLLSEQGADRWQSVNL